MRICAKDLCPTFEWIDRYQHSTNIRVDFCVRPPLLKIIVDAFVADCGQEGHICHSDLLLLEALLPISLHGTSDRLQREQLPLSTFATFAWPPAFFAAGVTFFPAFFDGAYGCVVRPLHTGDEGVPPTMVGCDLSDYRDGYREDREPTEA